MKMNMINCQLSQTVPPIYDKPVSGHGIGLYLRYTFLVLLATMGMCSKAHHSCSSTTGYDVDFSDLPLPAEILAQARLICGRVAREIMGGLAIYFLTGSIGGVLELGGKWK
jgi:hypothetical protein